MRFLLLILIGLHSAVGTSQTQRFSYLALGDSYTIGTAISPENSYATKLADSLQSLSAYDSVELKIIARNGWTTQDLINGIDSAQPDSNYNLVTLLIGVNNQYQGLSPNEYEKEFKLLLQKAIAFADNRPQRVLVLSIPDWSATPAGRGKRVKVGKEIDQFNQINQEISRELAVHYLNITGISRKAQNQSDLVAKDNLHFSAKMHQLWLNMIINAVSSIIKNG